MRGKGFTLSSKNAKKSKNLRGAAALWGLGACLGGKKRGCTMIREAESLICDHDNILL